MDSFYLEDDGPPPESAGSWHRRCLIGSPYGRAWYEARLRNYVSVRRFEELSSTTAWTVLRNPRTRETFALSTTGESLSLLFEPDRPRSVDGGSVHRRAEEYNLELADLSAIKAIQEALLGAGSIPVLEVLALMGIGDLTEHAEALDGSVFRRDRSLSRGWSATWVAARAEYGVFVPTELEPYVERGRHVPSRGR